MEELDAAAVRRALFSARDITLAGAGTGCRELL